MRFISRLLRDERGMTMIELMVAAVICSVGIIATVGVIDGSRDVSVKSEKRDVMAHQAEREVERLMELPWANFAHAANWPPSSDPDSPASKVTSAGAYKYDGDNPSASEPFAVAAAGQVATTFGTWDDTQSRLSGRVYRFVTRIDANSRRLTVVVTADEEEGAEAPESVLVSTIKTTPIL